MYKRGNKKAAAVTVAFILSLACSPQALCDVIDINASAAVLYAGGDLSVGGGSSVAGAIAAGGSVTAGRNAAFQSIYAEATVHLGEAALVRGRVLAGGAANADKNLDFRGPSWTGSGVLLAQDARVTGNVIGRSEPIVINQDAIITGSVLGNNDIRIDRGSSVSGDVSPGLGHSLTTGSSVTITGSTATGYVSADGLGPVALPAAPVAGSYGSQDISKENSTVTTLGPGAYGSFSFGRSATLNLSAGTYTLRDFWMDRQGVVNVDATAGDVIINIHESLATGHTVRFDVIGDGHLTLNVFGEGGVSLGHSNEIAAAVRCWDGDFTADYGLWLTGSVWAGDINIGDGAVLAGQGAVPEPAAMTILALGVLLVLGRQTRRGRFRGM